MLSTISYLSGFELKEKVIEFGLISLHLTRIVPGGTESSAKNSTSRSSIYL